MTLKNTLTYYYSLLALRSIFEQGKITEDEYKAACRYNAEIFQPDPQYIQLHS